MRVRTLCALFLVGVAAAAQPIARLDFLVENPAAAEFTGVIWIPAGEVKPESVIVTEAADQAQRRAFELPSQVVSGRVAVFLTIKPGDRKVVAVHVGRSEQILRLKSVYPAACDSRLLRDAVSWQSDRVAYTLRGGRIEIGGRLSAQYPPTPAIGAIESPASVKPEVIAAGPVVAAVQSGETRYSIARGSRWTEVETRATDLSLPERPGESILEGPHWTASFAGSPALGIAFYIPPEYDGGRHGRTLMLRPDSHGKVRYAFAAFWELEHRENVVEPGTAGVPIPRVPGMDRTATTGRILLRPPRMSTRQEFEERLRRDLSQFGDPPKVTKLPPVAPLPSKQKSYDEALALMVRRIRMLAEQGNGRFWFSSNPEGTPAFVDPKRSWGDGYWVSLLWDGFHATGDEWYRTAALDANRRMLGGEERQMHATGLNYWDGSARSFRETRDAQWRASGLRCADMMARIADPVTGLIPEYGPAERRRPDDPYDQSNYVKIDALVGLPVLWWAYEQTGEARYLDAANRHLRATMARLIEPDGAALQMLWQDPKTGRILGIGTSQGYGGSSRWARGLGWVLDGLPDAYRVTRAPEYRAQFERSARWLERNLPEDLISWYDFDDQGIFWRYRDSSTSAISAYGLLRMSEVEPDPALAAWYRQFGICLVNALIDRALTPSGTLALQCYTKPQEGEFIWGTYSLVRSLCWLKEKQIRRYE